MNISNHVQFSRKMDISFPSLVVEWKYSSFDHRFYTISFKLNFIFILRVIFNYYLDILPRRCYYNSCQYYVVEAERIEDKVVTLPHRIMKPTSGSFWWVKPLLKPDYVIRNTFTIIQCEILASIYFCKVNCIVHTTANQINNVHQWNKIHKSAHLSS